MPSGPPVAKLGHHASPEAWAARRVRGCEVQVVGPVLWRNGTAAKPLRLIVNRAPGHRLSQQHRILYRRRACLLTSDLELPLAPLLIASAKAFGDERGGECVPLPRWRNCPPNRPSLNALVARLRQEAWTGPSARGGDVACLRRSQLEGPCEG